MKEEIKKEYPTPDPTVKKFDDFGNFYYEARSLSDQKKSISWIIFPNKMQVMFFLTGRFIEKSASLVIVGFRHIHGTRNIPFRGHRDDSSQYSTQDSGNFQALLDFRVRSGDQVLADHFKNAPRNATYRSKRTNS